MSSKYSSRIKRVYRKVVEHRFIQGDLLTDVEFTYSNPDIHYDDEIELRYAFVISQDCDLEQDYNAHTITPNNDKYIRTILICPAFSIEDLSKGEHIPDVKLPTIDPEKLRANNELKRYHCLPDQLVAGKFVPELVIDFKLYYTVPRDMLYQLKDKYYYTSMEELFREYLSQRFANYLSRIGLPKFEFPVSASS